MNIFFRVNGGSSVGMGHLMRCHALAQCLESYGIKTHFIVNTLAIGLCAKRTDWVGQLLPLPEFSRLDEELAWLEMQSAKYKVDAIVIDGYDFTSEYRQSLKSLDLPIICFDDMNNSGGLWADLIINGAQNAQNLEYETSAPGAILCLGEQYRVMRKEFAQQVDTPFKTRTDLLVTMGGSDPAMLTLPILKALEVKRFEGAVSVVTGAANHGFEAIGDYLKNSSLNVKHYHDCQTMASLMGQSRLAISAAGGSQFELLACTTPSVLVVVADNQLNATQGATAQGWSEMQDMRAILNSSSNDDCELTNKVESLAELTISLWADSEKLVLMHRNARANCDRNGAQRVVIKIKELLSDRH